MMRYESCARAHTAGGGYAPLEADVVLVEALKEDETDGFVNVRHVAKAWIRCEN